MLPSAKLQFGFDRSYPLCTGQENVPEPGYSRSVMGQKQPHPKAAIGGLCALVTATILSYLDGQIRKHPDSCYELCGHPGGTVYSIMKML
jgi:hypothetical protein